MAFHGRIIRAQLDLLGIMEFGLGNSHVLGDIDQHRAGPAGRGDVERFFDGFGQLGDVFDQKIMLDAGSGDADRIHFLKGIIADQRGGHLAGDDHHRNGVHIGRGDTGDRIGDARAGSDQHRAGFAGGAGIAVGGVGGGLFVAHQHMFDIILDVDGIIDMQHRAAGIAKQVFDAFLL